MPGFRAPFIPQFFPNASRFHGIGALRGMGWGQQVLMASGHGVIKPIQNITTAGENGHNLVGSIHIGIKPPFGVV